MFFTALFALFSLSGCVTWIDQDPGCGYAVYDWSDDLMANIMAGDGSGDFDYDPIDVPRNQIEGDYSVNSGDYSWSVGFADSYYISDADVSGYGTAYHNGNLDILQLTSYVDVLGQEFESYERTNREGCFMVSEYYSDESKSDLFVQSGEYTGNSTYEWSAAVAGYTWQGTWRDSLSRTETIDAEDGSYYTQITTTPEGTAQGDISYVSGTYDYAGDYLRRFDGGEEYTLECTENGNLVANIASAYNYDGSGTETHTYADGTRCDFEISTNQSCTYECSDGSGGSC